MVGLVWFPGYMDLERRKYTWEIRGQTRTFAERGHLHNVYLVWGSLRLAPIIRFWVKNKNLLLRLCNLYSRRVSQVGLDRAGVRVNPVSQ